MAEIFDSHDPLSFPNHSHPIPQKRMNRVSDFNFLIQTKNLPDMVELIANNQLNFSKEEDDQVWIRELNSDTCVVSFSNGNIGVIETQTLPTGVKLIKGDLILVRYCSKTASDLPIRCQFIKLISREKLVRNRAEQKSKYHAIAKQKFIIDASNICRSFNPADSGSSLLPLLTLVLALCKRQARIYCVFDANERYILQNNVNEVGNVEFYQMLLDKFKHVFFEVTPGTQADDYLLELADRFNLIVISNDHFDKQHDQHTQQYSWLRIGSKRLISGTLENQLLCLPNLGLELSLRGNLPGIISELLRTKIRKSF